MCNILVAASQEKTPLSRLRRASEANIKIDFTEKRCEGIFIRDGFPQFHVVVIIITCLECTMVLI